MADLIQIRRDTSANWTDANPMLADGEIAYDQTINKFKIGNGLLRWNALPFTDFDFNTENFYNKQEIDDKLDNKVTVPTQSEWDNFTLTLQG